MLSNCSPIAWGGLRFHQRVEDAGTVEVQALPRAASIEFADGRTIQGVTRRRPVADIFQHHHQPGSGAASRNSGLILSST